MSFYFDGVQSPTAANLAYHASLAGVQPALKPKHATFTLANLDLDETYTKHLEYKHLFTRLVQKHCPTLIPETYLYQEGQPFALPTQSGDGPWIIKPALLNNAQGITLVSSTNDVIDFFAQPNRLLGPYVVQRYIDNPHLLNGHKYSFRLFVVATNYAGAFLYPHGYFNVACEPYQAHDFTQLNSHLTNEHLSHEQVNVWQIPTTRCPNFEVMFDAMNTQAHALFQAYFREFPHALNKETRPAFSLFGLDFLVDDALEPWLLEVNHGPCFPTAREHALQTHLYDGLWQNVITQFMLPIMHQTQLTHTPNYPFIELTIPVHLQLA